MPRTFAKYAVATVWLLIALVGGAANWGAESPVENGPSENVPAEETNPEKPPPENELAKYHHPVLIRVEGEIGPWLEQYVYRKIARAKAAGADLLIFEIDSPGGGVNETLNMCDAITELHGIHTVAFIPREALSGGAILALACNEIIVGETARVGDAGLIEHIRNIGFIHAEEKYRTHLIARVRALAVAQEHPAALAEAMVDKNIKVVRIRQPDGTEQLYTDREVAGNPAMADWEKLETLHESGDGRFLELMGRRAKDLGLASSVVNDRESLFKHFNLEGKPLVLHSNGIDFTAALLNTWLVTALLLVIGLVALAYEMSAPGVGIGGLTAGFCFVLFFWARFLGGTSGWLEVLLFASGVVFLAVELFVIPGFGVAGISGLLLIFVSIVLASQEFVFPRTMHELATTAKSSLVAVISGGIGVAICSLAVRHMNSIPMLNRLILKPPVASDEPLFVGKEGKEISSTALAVGDWGVTTTFLRPGGKVQFGDQLLDAVSEGAFLQAGEEVRIVELQGSRIVVERAG